MGLSKAKNGFDPTAPDSCDNIGSYLRASDGTLLTHTDVGGKKALDVNVANDLTVDVDGVYDAGTNTNPDNVGAIFHSRAAAPSDVEQVFRSTGANPDSDAVASANVHGIDVNSFLMAYNGASWDRVESTANGIKVDIGDSIEIEVSECYSDYASSQVAVTDTEAVIGGLVNRCEMTLFNTGKRTVYIGKTGVDETTGFCIPCGGSYTSKFDGTALYAVTETGDTSSLCVMEHAK